MTASASAGRSVAAVQGGLLTEGLPRTPAGVIIEKMGLLGVSNGPSRQRMFGRNVFTLHYPTHCDNVTSTAWRKLLKSPVK